MEKAGRGEVLKFWPQGEPGIGARRIIIPLPSILFYVLRTSSLSKN